MTTTGLAFVSLTIWIAAAGAAAGCDGLPRAAQAAEHGLEDRAGFSSLRIGAESQDEARVGSFTVVVLPDTQYYAAAYPEILDTQTKWIVGERDAAGIALVVHEGDIVDRDEPSQWERASRSLHVLDGIVPYVLSAGNHDYERAARVISRATLIDHYFPAPALARGSRLVGAFESGRIENTYEIVDMVGSPWLILSLEFGPRDAVLAWADDVAKRFASLPAIVVTHAYLYSDDTRYDHLSRPISDGIPIAIWATRAPAASTMGKRSGASSSRGTTTSRSCSVVTISETGSDV